MLYVRGALAVGIAQDLDDGWVRPDDFTFAMAGTVDIAYDRDLLNSAVEDLTELQNNLGVAPPGELEAYDFSLSGFGSTKSGAAAVDEMDQLLQTHGAGYDFGIDPALLDE